MAIQDEIRQLIAATKHHLDHEENLPRWEVCTSSTLAFYKNPQPKASAKPTAAPVSVSHPHSPPPPTSKPTPLPQKPVQVLPPPPFPPAPAAAPTPPLPPAASLKAPVNHAMFKSLCKELFPDLKILEGSSSLPSEVIILYDDTTSDNIHLFLEKIAEALRARSIKTTLTTLAALTPSPLTLILGGSRLLDQLPSSASQSPTLSLEDPEFFVEDVAKKKLLWQQLRTLLGI